MVSPNRSPALAGATPALCLALLVVILCGLSTPAAEESPGPRSEALPAQAVDGASAGGLRQIQPGHYVYMHTDDTPGVSSTFNSGITVTSEGVVVVDALGSEEIARRVREAIARVTDQPVRFLVSSTFHGRFTGGNAVYRDVFNIGHERYRADLMGLLQDATPEDRADRVPDQTYRERVTLHLGGKEIRILHLGRAHTRGDSIVFVSEDRIAYLSEVFNFDEFPYTRDSYPGDWLRTLHVEPGATVEVVAEASLNPDLDRLDRLELVVHGEVVATEPANDRDRVRLRTTVTADRSLWLAVRAFGERQERGNLTVAHSAPIYVIVEGRPFYRDEHVPELVALQRTRLHELLTEAVDPNRDLEPWETRSLLSEMWPAQRRLLEPRVEEADARYRALLAAVEDSQR